MLVGSGVLNLSLAYKSTRIECRRHIFARRHLLIDSFNLLTIVVWGNESYDFSVNCCNLSNTVTKLSNFYYKRPEDATN